MCAELTEIDDVWELLLHEPAIARCAEHARGLIPTTEQLDAAAPDLTRAWAPLRAELIEGIRLGVSVVALR